MNDVRYPLVLYRYAPFHQCMFVETVSLRPNTSSLIIHVVTPGLFYAVVFATLTCVEVRSVVEVNGSPTLAPCTLELHLGRSSDYLVSGKWWETKDAGNQCMPQCDWVSWWQPHRCLKKKHILCVQKLILINPSSLKGVATTPPQTVFALVLKSHSQGVKLLWVPSSSSFPFILAKKISNLPPTPEVG